MYSVPIFMHSFMRSEQVHKTDRSTPSLLTLAHTFPQPPKKTKNHTARKPLTTKCLLNHV